MPLTLWPRSVTSVDHAWYVPRRMSIVQSIHSAYSFCADASQSIMMWSADPSFSTVHGACSRPVDHRLWARQRTFSGTCI